MLDIFLKIWVTNVRIAQALFFGFTKVLTPKL